MIFEVKTRDELVWNGRPLVVYFTQPNCNFCEAFAPHFANVAKVLADDVDFYEVNFAETPEIVHEFDVEVTPTVIFIDQYGGKELNERTTLPLIAEIHEHLGLFPAGEDG